MPGIAPKLITVSQAAALIGIGKTAAYCWARSGELPGIVRISGRLHVRRAMLERWLEGIDTGTDAVPRSPG